MAEHLQPLSHFLFNFLSTNDLYMVSETSTLRLGWFRRVRVRVNPEVRVRVNPNPNLRLGWFRRVRLVQRVIVPSGWAGSEGLGWFRRSLCPQVGLVQKVIVPSGLVVVEGRCRRLLLFVQDYEEKLRCLQAECSAEQQSRALLQEHMASLRRAYHGQLASRVQSGASRGRCSPAHGEAAWICYVKRIIIKHNLFTMLGASVCCALGLVIQALSRCFHPQRSSRGRA